MRKLSEHGFKGLSPSALSLAALLFGSAAAQADDLPLPGPQIAGGGTNGAPEWSFGIAPYLWAAGIEGDVAQLGAPTANIDASFSDILENLDFAAMLVGEARYGRYGLFLDLMYVKISGSESTPVGVLADELTLDTETLAFTAAPEYRLFDSPTASVDAMAGLRVWAVDTKVEIDGGLLDGTSAKDDETWVDPLVGVKTHVNLTPEIYVSAWGMIGGFGISSDFMWDAWGGLGYQFNDSVAAVIGYRGTGVDYDDGPFLYDVIQHGPVIGAVFRF